MNHILNTLNILIEEPDFDRITKFTHTKIMNLKSRRNKLKNRVDMMMNSTINLTPHSLSKYKDELIDLETQIKNLENNHERIQDLHYQHHGHKNIYKEAKEHSNHYRGWDYWFDHLAPISGQWKATRAGVCMNANSEETLRHMIDFKMHPRKG